MAHGFLQSFDKNIEIFSGGTQPAAQVNAKAVEVMQEVGIDISSHVPTHVDSYLRQEWDYVITVCGDADANCPVTGTQDVIDAEFRRVRDEIRDAFARFYITEIQKKPLPKCSCGGNC